MSSLSRLRQVFTAKPSSISAATTLAVKPKPDSEPNPKPKRKPKSKLKPEPDSDPKPKLKPRRVAPSFDTVPADYETPEGLRKVVDKFKELCSDKRFRRRSSIYTTTVLRLAKAQAFPLIEEIIEAQKQYKDITTEGFVVRLMSLYGRARMPDHVLNLFDQMPTFNCSRTNMSLSALLNAFLAADRYDAVPDLFRDLSSKYSIPPDVVSFNVVVHAFCKMGSLDSALGVLDEMGEFGVEPNVVTFNTLLGPFYEKRGFDEGEKIWTMMKMRNVEHDAVSYMLRMSGMVVDGRMSDAVELFGVMRVNGVEPNNVHCFNLLIKGFVSDGKVEDAKYWYDELVRCECSPDRFTYVTLAPFLSEKGEFDLAFQLCKAALGRKGLLIDAEALKRVVEGFVANGRIEQATELVDRAREKKLEVDLPLNSM